MNELLGNKKFFGGEHPDIVDFCLMSIPIRLAVLKESAFKDFYEYLEVD